MFGSAATLAVQSLQYFFGSSAGSQKKDEGMARISLNAAGTGSVDQR